MKKIMNKRNRVDIQVSILTIVVVTLSVLIVCCFNYQITYQGMIRSLQERANCIYIYMDSVIKETDFTQIHTPADQQGERYAELQKIMQQVKATTGVMYLYTAKKNKDGQFVYMVDGLDPASEDFRNVGDLIETEIWSDLDRALDNQIVFPKDIIDTSWGHIFVSYFPVHAANGDVLGVIGIEFNADGQYRSFSMMRVITPVIALIAIGISVLVSVVVFRRISNPTYKDLANTDYLTQLKNRNAFEVDMNNIQNSHFDHIGIGVIDLNGLKYVNDHFGHQSGDEYIKTIADIVGKTLCESSGIVYRIGGDEFVFCICGTDSVCMKEYKQNIYNAIDDYNQKNFCQYTLSVSIGTALFDRQLDVSLIDTYQRADHEMYKEKEQYYRRKKEEML